MARPAPPPKPGHVSVHNSTFKDFLLKDELLRAIADFGFEHPSEVQHECIPQAALGGDIVCQARSGMGKTAVFVLSTLQLLEDVESTSGPNVLVVVHARELAVQITKEFERFSKYFKHMRCLQVYGGLPISEDQRALKETKPNVVVGTPGRLLALLQKKALDLTQVKHFILDECDKVLQSLDMRADVQQIFKATPLRKQVLMFTATLPTEVRALCKKFMKNPLEVIVGDDKALTHAGLQQFCVELPEDQKNRKLAEIIDSLDFNQVCDEDEDERTSGVGLEML